ncbi:hypothetical protein D9M69_456360 [compost metagenome]
MDETKPAGLHSKWARRFRPCVVCLQFIVHVGVLLIWVGGIAVLWFMAFSSPFHIVGRFLMFGVGAFMAYFFSIFAKEFWQAWFKRR